MGTPQLRSRVTARGCRSSTRFRENLRTLGREPLLEHARKGGQVQHEVFGVDELWCFTVDTRTWGEQIDRVELVATVVALVAAGSVVTADGAGALDVAVGKCTPGGGRHGPLG